MKKRPWTIRVEGTALQSRTIALQVKDGCYVSANTKLVAWDKAVSLSAESLALQFLEAI